MGVTKKSGLDMSDHFWVCCVFFVGCSGSEKPPIDIEVTFRNSLYWIDTISNVDSIAILSAKINRGDCANNE